MFCPVALLADAGLWMFRAGILLLIRLSSAVALAATAFSAAIVLADHLEQHRAAISDTGNAPASVLQIAFVLPDKSD